MGTLQSSGCPTACEAKQGAQKGGNIVPCVSHLKINE